MNKKSLLDTSAVIALLKKERGFEQIEQVISSASISTVNLCELISVLTKSGIDKHEVDEITFNIVPDVILFTELMAKQAGRLIEYTKSLGLSLGDRACIATGMINNMNIYTADKAWSELNIEGVNIIQIR